MNSLLPQLRVGAIWVKDGQLLLVQHQRASEKYWVLPGGKVKWGETLGEALRREIKEELNLECQPLRLVLVNEFISRRQKRHVVNFYFKVVITGGEISLKKTSRVIGMRFFPLKKLPQKLYPLIKTELIKVIENKRSQFLYLGNRSER
jgi:ADP-ribose pyrophosphatase YjhB (NUDIX family)